MLKTTKPVARSQRYHLLRAWVYKKVGPGGSKTAGPFAGQGRSITRQKDRCVPAGAQNSLLRGRRAGSRKKNYRFFSDINNTVLIVYRRRGNLNKKNKHELPSTVLYP
jgi:hypothetical protein